MDSCLFCKIIDRKIPSQIVFEDDDLFVFMDIGPVVKGHVLIVPKTHYNLITEVPSCLLGKLFAFSKKVVDAQMNGIGAEGANVIQNNGRVSGQEVDHFHIHVIPRFEEDGHSWNWDAKSYSNVDEMATFSEKLKKELI